MVDVLNGLDRRIELNEVVELKAGRKQFHSPSMPLWADGIEMETWAKTSKLSPLAHGRSYVIMG